MGERADLRFVVIVRGPTDYVDTIAEVRRREPSRSRWGEGCRSLRIHALDRGAIQERAFPQFRIWGVPVGLLDLFVSKEGELNLPFLANQAKKCAVRILLSLNKIDVTDHNGLDRGVTNLGICLRNRHSIKVECNILDCGIDLFESNESRRATSLQCWIAWLRERGTDLRNK